MPHRFCHSCRAPLHGADKHGEWVSCLGAPPTLKQHSLGRNATTAVTGVSPLCSSGYLSFQRATPSLVPSHLFPPRDLRGKSSGAEDLSTRKWVSLHRLYPRITHSLFTCPDQHPFAAARDMVSFGGAVSAVHCSPVTHSPATDQGERNNLAPPAWTMGATSLASQWEPSDLPESVLNTISQARAPSTRRLYALKWSVFSVWCTTHSADTVLCDISLILSFLQ